MNFDEWWDGPLHAWSPDNTINDISGAIAREAFLAGRLSVNEEEIALRLWEEYTIILAKRTILFSAWLKERGAR